MEVDLSEEGLSMFFKPWQVPLVEQLLTTDTELRSRPAWELVNDSLQGDESRSRASVIIFLQDLVRKGLLDQRTAPGKGGLHELYRRKMTLDEFYECVRCQFNEKIDRAQSLQGSANGGE